MFRLLIATTPWNRFMALQAWFKAALRPGIVRNAAITAAIVGPILTAINQGDRLIAGDGLDWIKVVLTFAVPYLVATVAGANAYRAASASITSDPDVGPELDHSAVETSGDRHALNAHGRGGHG